MLNCKIHTATCIGNSSNCIYPNEVLVSDRDSLIKAISFDHVTAQFKGNYRNKDNFIESTCIPMDCDNDHSDDEKDWVTPFDVALAFPGVCFFASYSRNHMKVKGNKSARPRFHVYFPIEEIKDAEEYSSYKEQLYKEFSYFDDNALDAARFIYGISNPEVELYDGELSIIEFLKEDEFAKLDEKVIESGSRNNTMSHIAGKLIKRFGATDEAHEKFLEQANRCDPPLSDEELSTIWNSAKKFGDKVSSKEGYIPPEEYGRSYEEYKPQELTDIAMAEVFSKHNKDKAIYTVSAGWLYWDEKKWEVSELKVMHLYMETAKKVLKNATYEFREAYTKLMQAEMDGAKDVIAKANSESLQKCLRRLFASGLISGKQQESGDYSVYITRMGVTFLYEFGIRFDQRFRKDFSMVNIEYIEIPETEESMEYAESLQNVFI